MATKSLREKLLFVWLLIAAGFLIPQQSPVKAKYPLTPAFVEPGLKELASSKSAMVVSPHPFATNAGLEMLRRGGNAMDAATAAMMTMAIMEWNISLAGGHQLTYYDAKNNRTICINADCHSFKEDVMPYDSAVDNVTGRSILVPGVFAGFYLAQKKYGALPWKEVFEPAIFYTENGIPFHNRAYRRMWESYQSLTLSPSARLIFAPNGFLPGVGEIFKQPELAETLKKIAEQGPDYFYKGPFAEKMVNAIREVGGKPTLEDFSSYQALELEPLKGTYKDFQIMGPPLPGTAAVTIIEGMNILENVDLKGMGHYTQSADSLQWVVETLRVIFDDAGKFSGVPEFDNALGNILISKDYAKTRYSLIQSIIEQTKREAKRSNPTSQTPLSRVEQDEEVGTEHVSTVDKDGNICSITNSIFGPQPMPVGLFVGGIAFNCSGGFRRQPGGRMVSPLAPMIVFKGEKPFFATGSTGGTLNTFIAILNILAWDKDFKEAQEAPRFQNPARNSNQVRIENRLDSKIAEELKKRGYRMDWAAPYSMAGVQIAGIDPKTGIRYGAAEPRNMGKAEGLK